MSIGNRSFTSRLPSLVDALIVALAISSSGIAPPTASAVSAPFLFNYTFDHHLKLGGGNFTMNGLVRVYLKFNNGTVFWSRQLQAVPHSITAGGTVYVQTSAASPCRPGNNGYARAYDVTTKTWSPRLPVPICVPID